MDRETGGRRIDIRDQTAWFHIAFMYSCTNWTAMAPSPTAEATRLMEPSRTSPAVKTPGRLVSSRKGSRRPGQTGRVTALAGVLDRQLNLAAQGPDQHVPAALIRRGGLGVNHQ
jgi:hypothetical protein